MFDNKITTIDESTLSSTFLFDGYSNRELADLLGKIHFEVRTYLKGAIIFSPESFRRELGVILSGRVLVTKGELTVSELAQGDIFGAAALFNDEERYASALTVRERCRVVFFPQETVREIIDNEERARNNYVRYLSGRIRFLSGKIDTLTQSGGRMRLSSYLLGSADDNGVIHMGCSMTELSSRLCIGRATLYREMGRLEDRGVIVRHGRTITVLKPEELGEKD